MSSPIEAEPAVEDATQSPKEVAPHNDRTKLAGLIMSIPRVRGELDDGHFAKKIDAHSATILAAALQVFVKHVSICAIVAAKKAGKKTVGGEHVANGIMSDGLLGPLVDGFFFVGADGKKSKKTEKVEKKPEKKGKKKPANYQGFSTYNLRVFKDVGDDVHLAVRAHKLIDSATDAVFHSIANTAQRFMLVTKRRVLRYDDILAAIELVFPGKLAREAAGLADTAMTNLRNAEEQEEKE